MNKVISPIRQRWHALFFDPELLSEDTIHVNLFQMLIVAAHRFTILIDMLPFVNHDMHFFRECIHQILKKMVKGIYRSLERSKPKKTSCEYRDRSSKSAYQAQKHQVRTKLGFIMLATLWKFNSVIDHCARTQVWAIGLHAFQLTIQAKRDQVEASNSGQPKHKCQWADWQRLLAAVQTEQEEFKQRAKKTQGAGRRSAYDLDWLLQDRRNASVLKQFLQLGVGSL